MIRVFDMLIERIGNLEAAVTSHGRMLQNMADERTYRLEGSKKGTRFRPAAIGSSLRGFDVHKMYDGNIDDHHILVLDISLADGMTVFDAGGAFGKLIPAADVGLTGTPHVYLNDAWIEAGLKGIAPSVVAVGSRHVVFKTRSLRDSLDVVHRARELLRADTPSYDDCITAYSVPGAAKSLAIAYVRAADRETALEVAWATLTPEEQKVARKWAWDRGPWKEDDDFLDRAAITKL